MRTLSFFVLLLLGTMFVTWASATCWSAALYHAAASALATGLGDLESSAVCIYSAKAPPSNQSLDETCPLPCQSLLRAAWGDCYCLNPGYRALAWGADRLVYNMSVEQMFRLVATPTRVKTAYCREWMQDNEGSWKC